MTNGERAYLKDYIMELIAEDIMKGNRTGVFSTEQPDGKWAYVEWELKVDFDFDNDDF